MRTGAPSEAREQRPSTRPDTTAAPWTELVAVGLVLDDLAPAAIARTAGSTLTDAAAALEQARSEGMLADDGTVEAAVRARLIDALPASRIAEIHATAARHALGGSSGELRAGLRHLDAAVATLPNAELLELADRAGGFALDIGDAEAARDLLLLAREHDLGNDPRATAARELDLSRAMILLGDSSGAHAHLLRAILLAEEAGDSGLATQAAERLALPADWQAGDPRVMGVLERVQRMPGLEEDDRVRLLAVRAWVEARLPVAQIDDQQVSWIGRPGIARPLAEEALAASTSEACEPATRLLVLLAWRHTHRAPQFLDVRRRVSEEALRLAEQLNADAEQVEAAVLLAVDALEDGDRTAHRTALRTAAAVADRSGQARLRWRALVPAVGAALMDGDVGAARAIAEDAFAAGGTSGAPGLLASQWTFTGQLAARHDDGPSIDAAFTTDARVIATSSLGRAGLSLLLARSGRREEALAHARATFHQLDEESSVLLSLTRLADATVALGDADLAGELLDRLTPWSGRVVVDANGWWCDGPVDLWLAELERLLLGADPTAEAVAAVDARLDTAELLARTTGDTRSLQRIAVARGVTRGAPAEATLEQLGLTDREVIVLELLARGLPYHAIAKRVRFSVSTVRNDAVSIYRRLGVRGRSEAAARAVALGLVTPEG